MSICSEVLLVSESTAASFSVGLYDPLTNSQLGCFPGPPVAQRSILLPYNEYMLVAHANKAIIQWWPLNSNASSIIHKSVLPNSPTALCLSIDSRLLAIACDNGLLIYHTLTGKHIAHPCSIHFQPITCVVATGDGEHWVTGSKDTSIKVWSIYKLITTPSNQISPEFILKGHSLPVTDLHVTRDSSRTWLLSASIDRSVRLWDFRAAQLLVTFAFDFAATSVRFDSDVARFAFVALSDCTIHSIDLYSSQIVPQSVLAISSENSTAFIGHTDSIHSMVVTSDSKLLLSASKDCTVRTWDIHSAQCVRVLKLSSSITSILLTPASQGLIQRNVPSLHHMSDLQHKLTPIDSALEEPLYFTMDISISSGDNDGLPAFIKEQESVKVSNSVDTETGGLNADEFRLQKDQATRLARETLCKFFQ